MPLCEPELGSTLLLSVSRWPGVWNKRWKEGGVHVGGGGGACSLSEQKFMWWGIDVI